MSSKKQTNIIIMSGYKRWLLFATLLLMSIGVVMVFSASMKFCVFNEDVSPLSILKKQLLFALLSIAVMYLFWQIDHKIWREFAPPFMAVAVVLLCLVLIPGIGAEVNNARRWFRFFGIGFQPSEVVKLAIILLIAHVFSEKQQKILSVQFLPALCLGLAAFVSILVLLEPDFGNAVFIFLLAIIMLFLAGTSIKYLVIAGIGVPLLLIALAWLFGISYIFERIETFANRHSDILGGGYQVHQSLIALGAGGLFGKGLGMSLIKFSYLPYAESDFILPVIGEEIGFVGVLFILSLFCIFLFCGFKIASCCKDRFSYLVASGIVVWITLSALSNFSVVTGLLPTKGAPLPFISMGGTSLLVSSAATGVLLNIADAERVH